VGLENIYRRLIDQGAAVDGGDDPVIAVEPADDGNHRFGNFLAVFPILEISLLSLCAHPESLLGKISAQRQVSAKTHRILNEAGSFFQPLFQIFWRLWLDLDLVSWY
jgi:hypothetical protein